ncbi:MAG TPA: HAD family hydrolase [Candidatus Brocadiales bacterium]|nr:HAD family hydrolase [Candidatus Brocadiales bacterium]
MNALREEFLLLAERLKLDTRSIPPNIIGTPECTPSFLDAHFTKTIANIIPLSPFNKGGLRGIYVGPCIASWSPLTLTLPLKGGGKGGGEKLSDRTLESLVDVYKKLFLSHRRIWFIGVDLDDCLYDVTPIRHLLVQKIHTALKPSPLSLRAEGEAISWALYNAYKDDLEAEDIRKQKALTVLKQYVIASEAKSCQRQIRRGEQSNTKEIVERTYLAYKNFSRFDNPNIRALYKPYEGVKDTLHHLMNSGFVIGILTNGPSRLQRDKINLLGLKEGEHFNFVMVSEDVGISKPSREFFELAREKASRLFCHSERSEESRCIHDEECLILEDQVKNLSGADGWLKVQFLKGYHSNIPAANVEEIPKYGITEFSILPDLINLEKDSDFQAVAGSYFILKSLLLLPSEIP